MKYDYVTIVSVYGHNDGSTSIPSILKSSESLPGSKALLLSISCPVSLPECIAWKKIPPLNFQQYSIFMMYCLASFIKTDFALCVQADSWVLNQSAWTDNFLEYDYIGAPNGVGLNTPKSEGDPGCRVFGMLLRGESEWVNEKNPIGVMNGGFSLRSKKFLNAPRDIGIPYTFNDHPILQNEDLQLCILMKPQLIDAGIKFASLDVAKIFSFETYITALHSSLNLDNVFGIHQGHMRLVGLSQILFEEQFNPFYLPILLPYFKKLGYEVIYE